MKIGTEIDQIPIESNWNVGEIKKGQDYSWSDLIDLYSDLYDEYESLKDEYDHFKQEVEDNYKPIPVSEQYGISDRDFM